MSKTTVQEFPITLPKLDQKQFHLMRFNGNLNVDFNNWKTVNMERENNSKVSNATSNPSAEIPKFGGGSIYNRELKEEARRKRLGIKAAKYNPDAQPWILTESKKKKFRGIREGGVSDNAAYYVFMHSRSGAIEAYPLKEWYNFTPIQRYKALTAEEAEQEMSKREQTLNLFTVMVNKRLKNEGEDENLDEVVKKQDLDSSKTFKITELDEWMDSDETDSSDAEKESSEVKPKKPTNKKKILPKKKAKKDIDDEAFEESDDGDDEGRERDYSSESSMNDSDVEKQCKDLKSVAEEDGLRKLLTSDEEDDEEKVNEIAEDKKEKTEKPGDNFSESSDDDDSDTKPLKSKKKKLPPKKAAKAKIEKVEKIPEPSKKRKAPEEKKIVQAEKKPKFEAPPQQSFVQSGISEDAVRRYLMRKPMTPTELLMKFKNLDLNKNEIVTSLDNIIKRIKPKQKMVQNKLYLSLDH